MLTVTFKAQDNHFSNIDLILTLNILFLPHENPIIAFKAWLFSFCFVCNCFLLQFPFLHDSFLYVLLWIAGLFSLPVIISLFFGFGSMLGSFINSFFNLFKPKEKKPTEEYDDYEDVTDNPEYKDKDDLNSHFIEWCFDYFEINYVYLYL